MFKISYERLGQEWAFATGASYEEASEEAFAAMGQMFGLPAVSIKYLLQQGLTHSLTDSHASKRAKAVKDGEPQELIDQLVRECIGARYKQIAEGKVGVRGYSGRDPSNRVAKDLFKAWLEEKGYAAPKDKDKAEKLFERWCNAPANAAAIRAEVAKRSAMQEIDEDALSELLDIGEEPGAALAEPSADAAPQEPIPTSADGVEQESAPKRNRKAK